MKALNKILICFLTLAIVLTGCANRAGVNQNGTKPVQEETAVRLINPDNITAEQIALTEFSMVLEQGDIQVLPEEKSLEYTQDQTQMRTKEGVCYELPKGTSFELSDYADGSKLVVYCSYDGGNSFNSVICSADAPSFVLEQNARVALKITSLNTKLIKYALPTVYDWFEENKSRGTGKTIVNMGDSVFGFGDWKSISWYLEEFSGETVYNCSFGGTLVMGSLSAVEFNFPSLIATICDDSENKWDPYEAKIKEMEEGFKKDIYTAHFNTLKNIDFSTVDVLTIAFGTNDWAMGYWVEWPAPLVSTDGRKSVISTLEEGIKAINKTYPNIKVVLVTPIWRWFYGMDSDTVDHGTGTLEDFATEYEKLAKKLNIYYLDSYHNLTFNEDNRTVIYEETDDNSTHPNAAGRKLYAELINGFLKELY